MGVEGDDRTVSAVLRDEQGRPVTFYETDSLMYGGSSGCPGFLESGKVFGMHNRSVLEASKGGQRSAVTQGTRLAISMWVTSIDIVGFVSAQGIKV